MPGQFSGAVYVGPLVLLPVGQVSPDGLLPLLELLVLLVSLPWLSPHAYPLLQLVEGLVLGHVLGWGWQSWGWACPLLQSKDMCVRPC